MKRTLILSAWLISTAAGCGAMLTTPGDTTPTTPDDTSAITDSMRDACPILSDDVLEAFIIAVTALRDNGLTESDALVQWVQGCDNIPPDGNFEGDKDACAACLSVIVEDLYENGNG